ncbi:MAG: TetR/AcrR family transcriptional regulator [Hyphomicrobiales bacterium]|nr:TetR/AcrR family transcriptional regulator [Hyphomicrobiales bacterium]
MDVSEWGIVRVRHSFRKSDVQNPPPHQLAAKNHRREEKRKFILDAAERLFARSGYEGTGMRQISVAAGVAQALIHYHFDTKQRLFEAVVARRSREINQLREQRLVALFYDTDNPTIEQVSDVLLRPTIEVGHRIARSSNDFARILVSTATSADQQSVDLASRYFDPIARKFIEAYEKTVPGLGHENAVWAYLFAIGVGMTMMAQTGRPQRLSGGLCDDTDVEAMLARIIPFISAGILAVKNVEYYPKP